MMFSGTASTGLDKGDNQIRNVDLRQGRKRTISDAWPSLNQDEQLQNKKFKKEFESNLIIDGSIENNTTASEQGGVAKLDDNSEPQSEESSRSSTASSTPQLSIPGIIEAIESDDPIRQQSAASSAGVLAKSERHRIDLAEAGILPLLVGLLTVENVDLLRHVIGALWNLGVNIGNNREIVALGAVPALVKHLEHPEVRIQRVAAGAIRCLAWKHDINRTAIASAGGVPPLISLSSSSHFEVQVQAVAALWNLGLNTNVSEIITNDGAVKVMVRLAASNSVQLQRLSAGVLRCLAYMFEPNRINIAEEGGIKYLCRLLSSPNIKVQQQAAAALGNLTYRNGPNRITVTNEGGVERLIAQLQSKSAEVQLMAATTLRNLALNDDNRVALGRAGAIPALISLLDALKTDVLVQVAAALWNLSLNDQNKSIVYEHGGVDRLYALFRSTTLDVVYYAKGALFALGVEVDRPQQ